MPSFHQFRYFGENSSLNNVAAADLISGFAFNNYTPFVQIGVRALPGTKLYFDGGEDPIIIGFTGIFELDLTNLSSINSLKVDTQSINAINSNLNGGYIVIDILGKRSNGTT